MLLLYSAGEIIAIKKATLTSGFHFALPCIPWYFEGRAAKGIGSPHTGIDKIWHIALSMQALTSSNPEEIKECINMLTTTDAGTKLMHESFYKHDATDFTRPWFAWSNSLFAELLIRIAEGKIGC